MNILSQNFIDVLKNRLNEKILGLTNTFVDTLMKSFSNPNIDNKYLDLINESSNFSKSLVKEVIIEVINEFDNCYRNSTERMKQYNINKRSLPRTIITIIGEITFYRTYYETKDKSEHFCYIDNLLNLPKNDKYDPIVKGLAIRESFYTSQAQSGRIIGERICNISDMTNKDTSIFNIPRQSINNWLKDWDNYEITYDKCINTPKNIYIMVDEKYIGSQDLDNDIMAKTFVVFEDIKQVSKGRRKLVNRKILTFYSKNPWEELLDKLCEIYNYDEIENFFILSDGGNWITTGINELKVETFQKVEHLLCLFHFKQAINHITTDKDERLNIFNSFLNDKRKVFKNNLNKYIDKYPHKKDTITKKIKYILNHYKAAKHMINSNIGSSMESHISHYVASTFSSRPKGFSSENISKYFTLNDYKNNGINIFNLYLQTYDKTNENFENKESNNNINILKQKSITNSVSIPIISNGHVNKLFDCLNDLVSA